MNSQLFSKAKNKILGYAKKFRRSNVLRGQDVDAFLDMLKEAKSVYRSMTRYEDCPKLKKLGFFDNYVYLHDKAEKFIAAEFVGGVRRFPSPRAFRKYLMIPVKSIFKTLDSLPLHSEYDSLVAEMLLCGDYYDRNRVQSALSCLSAIPKNADYSKTIKDALLECVNVFSKAYATAMPRKGTDSKTKGISLNEERKERYKQAEALWKKTFEGETVEKGLVHAIVFADGKCGTHDLLACEEHNLESCKQALKNLLLERIEKLQPLPTCEEVFELLSKMNQTIEGKEKRFNEAVSIVHNADVARLVDKWQYLVNNVNKLETSC